MDIETSRIIRIPIDVEFLPKERKFIIKKEFNNKVREDTITVTEDGEFESCDLNNLFTISEYIVQKHLGKLEITDEELENGIKEGFKDIVLYMIRGAVEEEELPEKHESPALIVIHDTFATVAVELDIELFLEHNPDSRKYISEESVEDIQSIIISESILLVLLIGQEDQILLASIGE